MGERAPGGDPGAAMAPTSSPCSRARTRSQSLSCVEEQSHAVKYVTSLCATCTYAGTMCSLQASVVDLGGCSRSTEVTGGRGVPVRPSQPQPQPDLR
jgi:hypothetical protein